MPRRIAPALILFLTALSPAVAQVPASREQIQLSFAPVVRTAAPAVVNIYASRVVPGRPSPFADDPFFRDFFRNFGQTQPRVQNSLGSGVLLSPGGIAVSNFHVVGGASEIRVVLSDRREFDADILLADRGADIAVLQLRGAHDLPALDFADSDAVEVGDLVLAIGNPFGVGQTVTSGIVSGLARTGDSNGRAAYHIQTDAAINPGNSGGALVDMSGRLLGINTSILTRSGGSNGIGFAIPANLVRAFVTQAEAGVDRLAKPWSGMRVQPVDSALAEALGQPLPEGVLVADLHPLSPFLAAGIQPGDVLLEIDGKPVNAPSELEYRLVTTGPDVPVGVRYSRLGDLREATVTLALPPDDPPRDERRITAPGPFAGLVVANLNPALVEELDLPFDARGVAVVGTAAPGARIGLRPGDVIETVNEEPVADTKALERIATRGARGWDIVANRGGRRSMIRLR